MKQNPLKQRLLAVAVLFGLLLLLFFFELYDYQVIHGSEYRARSISSNATTEVVEASRGIITDRNGKTIISNRLAYTLTLSEDAFRDEQEENGAILRLTELCRTAGTAWVDTLPQPYKREMRALYEEMAARETLEAKVYKAMDNLEAVIQHNESPITTWEAHEYTLNQTYAFDTVAFSTWLTDLRKEILRDTLVNIDREGDL